MSLPLFGAIFQGTSLLVLAGAVYVAYRQLRAATDQARASERQARSSEDMAKASLQQSETMRAQLHATFRPVVTVTGGEYGANAATLTLTNVGTGPALSVFGIYRSGRRQSIGDLESQKGARFHFDNNGNIAPPPVGPPEARAKWAGPQQKVPLRLEYESVTGAKCWTEVEFSLGGQGSVKPELEYGMEWPEVTVAPMAELS